MMNVSFGTSVALTGLGASSAATRGLRPWLMMSPLQGFIRYVHTVRLLMDPLVQWLCIDRRMHSSFRYNKLRGVTSSAMAAVAVGPVSSPVKNTGHGGDDCCVRLFKGFRAPRPPSAGLGPGMTFHSMERLAERALTIVTRSSPSTSSPSPSRRPPFHA